MLRSLSVACFAIVLLSGCAARSATGIKAPPTAAPVAIGKSNRFEMTQNGRQMSARDFDAWMKARGIRIAKGSQAVKSPSRPKAQAKRR